MTLGVRRLHVLATPLSSFTACATSEAQAQAISEEPLLVQLATRMKTRVSTRVEPALQQIADAVAADSPGSAAAPFAGVAVINTDPGAVQTVQWLLQLGRRGRTAAAPPHPLAGAGAHSLGGRAGAPRHPGGIRQPAASRFRRRPCTSASWPNDGEAARPDGMRALLDARSEAQAVHGLEIRTELGFGDVAEELTRQARRIARSAAHPGRIGYQRTAAALCGAAVAHRQARCWWCGSPAIRRSSLKAPVATREAVTK